MEFELFALFLIATIYFYSRAFSKGSLFFSILSIMGSFALGGLLQAQGIRIVNGINTTTGAFTYSFLKASTDLSVQVLAMFFIVVGFFCIYWVFRILEASDWKVKL